MNIQMIHLYPYNQHHIDINLYQKYCHQNHYHEKKNINFASNE